MKILPTRLRGPLFATKRCGTTCAMCTTIACENCRTACHECLGASGTITCRPLPPLVFSTLFRPSSSRNDFISCAASRTAGHATPSPGSRSKIIRSGFGIVRVVMFQVCSSITFICAADCKPLAEATTSSAS